jgi:hypothetical protein
MFQPMWLLLVDQNGFPLEGSANLLLLQGLSPAPVRPEHTLGDTVEM